MFKKPFDQRLEEEVRSWAQTQGLGELTFLKRTSPQRLTVNFYPPAGSYAFEIDPQGVGFGVKTSIAGPGFHAATIDLADHLAKTLKLDWIWQGADGTCTDDSGFVIHRDFEKLQESFAAQMRATLQTVVDHHRVHQDFAVHVPIEVIGAIEGCVATPIGPRQTSDIVELAGSDESEFLKGAASLYPWWARQKDDRFWAKTCAATIWTEAQWRAPRTEYEKHIVDCVVASARNAGEYLASYCESGDLSLAVDELVAAVRNDQPPGSDGAGYRRKNIRAEVFPSWSLTLPGYFISSDEGDDTAAFYWMDTEVRATSFTVKANDPTSPVSWSDPWRSEPEHQAGSHAFRVEASPRPTSENEGAWIAMACCKRREGQVEHLLLLSLTDVRPDDLLNRLRSLAAGVVCHPTDAGR